MYAQIYTWSHFKQTFFKTFPTTYAQVHLSTWHVHISQLHLPTWHIIMSTWSTTKPKVSTQYNLQIYVVPSQRSFTTTYN